jgi:predicted CoA-binding protein
MKNANVIQVNPTISEVLLDMIFFPVTDIPERVDVIDIFRKPEDVPPVVSDTLNGKDHIKVIKVRKDISNQLPNRVTRSYYLINVKQLDKWEK